MLGYCSIPTFNASDAVWVLAEYYLIPIANGEIDPAEGLQQFVERIFYKYDFPSASNSCHDSHGFEYLYGEYCSYDDFDPYEENFHILMQNRSDLIVIYAKAWLKKHSPVLIKGE